MRKLVLVAFALLGCSSTGSSTDDAGVTTDPSGTGSSMSASTGMGTSTDSSTDETSMGETDSSDTNSSNGFPLDIADPPMPGCWTEELTLEQAEAWPECMLAPVDPNNHSIFIEVCVELPPSGSCADICPPDDLCEGMAECDYWSGWGGWFQMCGPSESVDGCCLLLEIPGPVTTD